MEYDDLISLLSDEDTNDNDIAAVFITVPANYRHEYLPQLHKVNDHAQRRDKQILRPDPTDPKNKTIPDTVKVARLPLALQKQIVDMRAQFLLGYPVELDATPTNAQEDSMLEAVQKIWADNKLDYKSKYLCKLLFSECEVAELWFMDENDDNYWQGTSLENIVRQSPEGDTITDGKIPMKFRMRIIAQSLGDNLYPLYDAAGDMIAFGRGYKIGDTEMLDIYTDKQIHSGSKEQGSDWSFDSPTNHNFGKIPIIYYAQDYPEWHDVQPLIERLETLLSNNADTNDYFGSPTAVATGNILSYVDKGESGKMVQVDVGGKIEYLTWDAVPAAIQLEWDTIMQQISTFTGTPPMDFKSLSNMGRMSAFTIKMMFMPAHMKASDKIDLVGECFQRRINLLKQFVAVAANTLKAAQNLQITPKFNLYTPKDDADTLANLVTATTGGIMSKETAIRQNPLIEDADAEIKLVNGEDSTNTPADINKEMNNPNPLSVEK